MRHLRRAFIPAIVAIGTADCCVSLAQTGGQWSSPQTPPDLGALAEQNASQPTFQTVHLGSNISLDLPLSWNVLPSDIQLQVLTATKAAIRNVLGANCKLTKLLNLHSPMKGTDGNIVITVSPGESWSEGEVNDFPSSYWRGYAKRAAPYFENFCSQMGCKFISIDSVKPFQIQGRTFVETTFRHTSPANNQVVQDRDYQLSQDGYTVGFSIEVGERERALIEPILERVRDSFTVTRD